MLFKSLFLIHKGVKKGFKVFKGFKGFKEGKGFKEFNVFKVFKVLAVPLPEGVGGSLRGCGRLTSVNLGAWASRPRKKAVACDTSFRVRKCPTCVEGETPSNRQIRPRLR